VMNYKKTSEQSHNRLIYNS